MGITCSANGQRQTATLNYEISTVWENEAKEEPSKDFWTVSGTGTGHQT